MILCDEILRYRAGKINRPFFYAPTDDTYRAVFDELTRDSNADVVKVSDFCMSDDRFPDIDALTDVLDDSPQRLKVIAGLGGYLALKGGDFTVKVLRRMNDISSRCVFLLRFVGEYARQVAESDRHMKEQERYFVAPNSCGNISVIVSGNEGRKGIKHLISQLEDGDSGEIMTDTALNLDGSLLEVTVRIPEHDAGLLGRIGAKVLRFFGGGENSQPQAITHSDNQQPQPTTHTDNPQSQLTTYSDNPQSQPTTHADNSQPQNDNPPEIHSKPAEIRSDFDAIFNG